MGVALGTKKIVKTLLLKSFGTCSYNCKAGKKIQSFWNCIVTDGIRSIESLPLKYQTDFESTGIKRSCISLTRFSIQYFFINFKV